MTDSLPAIALGMEAIEDDIMDQKPKSKNEGIFAHGLGIRIVLQGVMFAILTLSGFLIGLNQTGMLEGGQTMAFMVLSLSQVVHAYNMRSHHSLFAIGPFSNHKLNWAMLFAVVSSSIVIFTPVHVAFGLMPLPLNLYLIAVG
ncbi:MAG: cation-translocating P-type ATPase C-terminal domain-containing protein, partial [Evtepia sp.]